MPFVAVPDHLAGDTFTQTNWQTHLEGNLNAGVERPLYDIILGTTAASVDITGIPATFAQLRLEIEARSGTAATLDTLQIRFDNDTAANYFYEEVTCNGTTVAASEGLGQTSGLVGRIPAASSGSAAYSGVCVIHVPNYTSTAYRKRWVSQWSANSDATTGTVRMGQAGGYWNQSNLINRITVFAANASLAVGSRVTLYGLAYI